MDFRYDSFCGLYCGACYALMATRENRVEEPARAEGMEPEDPTCQKLIDFRYDEYSHHPIILENLAIMKETNCKS